MSKVGKRQKRVMAIASGGGHWVQLCRLAPAWKDCDVAYVTTDPGYRDKVQAMAAQLGQPAPAFHVVAEANRWQKWRVLQALFQIAWLVLRLRPHVIVTTGAAPGAIALRLGGLIGCRTVWVDSIANAETLSMSGQKAGPHADLWLTQWPHLAETERGRGGPSYRGSVL